MISLVPMLTETVYTRTQATHPEPYTRSQTVLGLTVPKSCSNGLGVLDDLESTNCIASLFVLYKIVQGSIFHSLDEGRVYIE